MSLADVVHFTSQPLIKNKIIGPVLLAVFENLIRQTTLLCDQSSFALDKIDAYSTKLNAWQKDLLAIYKNVYEIDCATAAKTTPKLRGLPEHMIANSKALKSLLDFLAARGNTQLKSHLDKTVEDVHNVVFGPQS